MDAEIVEFSDLSKINFVNLCQNQNPDIARYIQIYVDQMKKTFKLNQKEIFTNEALCHMCLNPLLRDYAKKIIPQLYIVKINSSIFPKIAADPEAIDLLEECLYRIRFDTNQFSELCSNPNAKWLVEATIFLQRKHLHKFWYPTINNSSGFHISKYRHTNSLNYIEKLVLMVNKKKCAPLIDWNTIFKCALAKNDEYMFNIIENNYENILRLKNLPLQFYANPNLIGLIEQHLQSSTLDFGKHIVYSGLCMNPKALHIVDTLDLSVLLHTNSGYRLEYLCRNTNPDVTLIVKKYIHLFDKRLDYEAIHEINKSAFLWQLLYEHIHLIDAYYLYRNPCAIPLINKLLADTITSKICKYICFNPNFLSIDYEKVIHHFDQNCWNVLCQREDTICVLEKYAHKLDTYNWYTLCSNPSALHILRENIDKICWVPLCSNTNPFAISIIERNIDKLNRPCWRQLSSVPSATSLLRENHDKICYDSLCKNTRGFDILLRYKIGYILLYKKNLNEQVIQFVLSPDWIARMAQKNDMTFMSYLTTLFFYN